jgi:hypothetical protein
MKGSPMAKQPSNVTPITQSTDRTGKQKSLDAAVTAIERAFGKNAVMRMGSKPQEAIEVISTGSLGLDIALGIGGLPKGRVIEIFGPESSGKTTLALHVIAEAQKRGGTCAFIDAEHALDPTYARKLFVNVDELLISQPDNGEQALEITDTLVRSGAIDVRLACGPPCTSHESGFAEAHWQHRTFQYDRHFPEPDPAEDRRHVRQSGDDHGR